MHLKPGRELDALVDSKIFGHTVEVPDPDSAYRMIDGESHGVPNYSTDIAAAWEIMEKLKAKHPILEFRQIEDVWNCSFSYTGLHRSETAPHAICLAALRAMDTLAKKEPRDHNE